MLRRLRAQELKIEIWVGRGDPMGAGSAFALIAEAIRLLVRV